MYCSKLVEISQGKASEQNGFFEKIEIQKIIFLHFKTISEDLKYDDFERNLLHFQKSKRNIFWQLFYGSFVFLLLLFSGLALSILVWFKGTANKICYKNIEFTNRSTKPNEYVLSNGRFFSFHKNANFIDQYIFPIKVANYIFSFDLIKNVVQIHYIAITKIPKKYFKLLFTTIKVLLTFLSYYSFFNSRKCIIETLKLHHNFGSFHLPLILAARKSNIKLIIKTHGIFFENNLEIFPLLENEFEVIAGREKEILLNCPGNKIVHIAPEIRTTDFSCKISKSTSYDLCILGCDDDLWYTELIFSCFRNISLEKLKILLRPHPSVHHRAMRSTQMIIDIINCPLEILKRRTLIEDICSARVIISASMDSIKTSLLAQRPVIYLANIEKSTFGLSKIEGFSVVNNVTDLKIKLQMYLSQSYEASKITSKSNLSKIGFAFGY